MKKFILALALGVSAFFGARATDTNQYIGTADVPYVQLNNGMMKNSDKP